jgi:hypothetical protein
MTDSNATGVDPRYDPRFQRGYSGEMETDASGSPSPSRPPRRSGSPQPTRPQRESLEELERRASERTARPHPPEYERFAPEERTVSSAPLADASAQAPVAAGDRAQHGVDPHTDRDSVSVAWFDESGAASTGSADPWFLGAWVMSAVALALGAGLFLSAVMAQDPYGGGNLSDRWLQYAGWTIAPSLVQGGLLGVVAMLVWTGVRRARAQTQRASEPEAEDAA